MEIWKDIPDYGSNYQASNLGRIRVKDRYVEKKCGLSNVKKVVKQFYKGKLLSPCKADKYGHLSVHIGYNNKKITIGVHRLVLFAFVGKCPDGMEACHNNGIASDNRIENLRWDTHQNNNKDRKMHGKYAKGENHHMFGKKMSEEQKQRLVKINTGKKASDETRKKMTESQKKRWQNRKNNAVLVEYIDTNEVLAKFTELDKNGNKLECIEIKSYLK